MDSDTCVLMFVAALFTIAKGRNKVCINRRIGRQNVVYIYTMEYYSALKRNEPLIHTTTWKNSANMISEICQIQKDK